MIPASPGSVTSPSSTPSGTTRHTFTFHSVSGEGCYEKWHRHSFVQSLGLTTAPSHTQIISTRWSCSNCKQDWNRAGGSHSNREKALKAAVLYGGLATWKGRSCLFFPVLHVHASTHSPLLGRSPSSVAGRDFLYETRRHRYTPTHTHTHAHTYTHIYREWISLST